MNSQRFIYFNRLVILLLAAFLITSCSGQGQGGGNGNINLSALILPEKVSVVDPQTSGGAQQGSGKPLPLLVGLVSTDLPPASDYESDRTTVYVNERSLEAFNEVNNILCMLRQSRYEDMINKGPYRAQVDKNLCSSKRSDASTAGQQSTNQSSGSTMPEYENWTVNSYRMSSESPHIVEVWVHSLDGPDKIPQLIMARATIIEGADTAPPYGIFKVNFKAVDPNDLTKEKLTAFLNAERDPVTQRVLLKFAMEETNSYYMQKATLDKTGDTGGGTVWTASTYTWDSSITRYNLAYDADYFRRDETGEPTICLNRNDYDVSAWKYGLYTMAGTRVNVNSGFSIKKGSSYGWIGYWGSWLPAGMSLVPGETVSKHDYMTNTDTPYTVIKAEGKLKKHTKNTVKLREIKNVPLVLWDAGNTYSVIWTGSELQTVAQLISGQTWSNFNSPIPIDLTNLNWFEIGFWSPSLGGSVIIKFPPPDASLSPTPTPSHCGYVSGKYDCSWPAADENTVDVVYYSENIVYPDDNVPATLVCFDNCPDVVNLSTNAPFSNIASYQSVTPSVSIHAEYRFDSTGMLLYSGASGTIPVTTSTPGSNFNNGITSGPLFDKALLTAPSVTIPSPLGCNWAPFSTTCGGNAWSMLPEFYTWETGPNEWNKFIGLKDSWQRVVKFDKPLQVQYVHLAPATNPTPADIKYGGVTFFLEYNGFGDLHGIPGKCVNIDTGADADCSAGGNTIRWVPEFTIPDTDPSTSNLTEVTNAANTSIKYIVKALEKEERMKTAPAGSCDTPSLATSDYPLPKMSSYIDPALGREPVVTAPPAVIGGVVQ
jgi:hypothetical protein